MNQVILHQGEKYINEDLDYYFSGERDKNNQIRPDKSLISMLPITDHIDKSFEDFKTSNFFYPQLPNKIDRIYLGISVSLFANHWGASFLIELLNLVKPGGVIILPVYPEGQAGEKGYWSRSFLENTFLSRSSWMGLSNLNAENDGVMSLRVGKKLPEALPSSIEWFYQERSNLLLNCIQADKNVISIKNNIQATFNLLCESIWREYKNSAIIERILLDNFSLKKLLNITHMSHDYGVLLSDLMLSPRLQINNGNTYHTDEVDSFIIENVRSYFAPLIEGNHSIQYSQTFDDLSLESSDIIIISDQLPETSPESYEGVIRESLSHLKENGIIILFENFSNNLKILEKLDLYLSSIGELNYYSSIVASKIEPNIAISHYSIAIEDELVQEAKNKDKVFRVIKKF